MRSIYPGRGWEPIATAPFNTDVMVVVSANGGEPYVLRMPCKRTRDGWVSSAKGTQLAVQPVKWREPWLGAKGQA